MELWRLKNTDTRILFPIIDADGDPVSGAASLDSEYSLFNTADHGGSAPSFADCTHEATEIGSTGVYYLDVSAAEINADYSYIQIKTSTTGAKTQHILIRTFVSTDSFMGAIADANCDEATSGHTTSGSVCKALTDALADTNELQTDNADGGRTDLIIDAINTKTTNLPASPAAVGSAMLISVGTGAGQINVSSGKVPATIAAGDLATDSLTADALKADAVTEIVHGLLDHAASGHLTAGTVGALLNTLIGKMTVASNQLKIYAADNTTLLATYNLTDSNGDPTMTNVYTRAVV